MIVRIKGRVRKQISQYVFMKQLEVHYGVKSIEAVFLPKDILPLKAILIILMLILKGTRKKMIFLTQC